MKKLTYLFSFVFIISCVTTEGYNNLLNTWIGASADRLVDSWGPPSQVYKKENGERLMTFVRGGQLVHAWITNDDWHHWSLWHYKLNNNWKSWFND